MGSHLAEVIPEPDGAADHMIGAELIRETGHLAEIKLRAHKKVPFHIDLNTGSNMHLEMVRTPDGGRLRRANRGPDTRSLLIGESRMGPADPALEPQLYLFVVDRRVQSAEIIERLPVLEWPVGTFGRPKVDFTAEAEVLIQHRVSLEAHE